MGKGKFVTFEGGEGAGKSTQAELLAGALEKSGLEVVLSREPGGSPGAEEIRQLLVHGETGRWAAASEALLHSAARADHLKKTVRPALLRGAWVICDRFADSTLAYQGYGQGMELQDIKTLTHLVVGDLEPDLTLILDLPVEEGLKRAAAREGGGDRYERMGEDFHVRLRDGFKAIAKGDPERCQMLDGTMEIAGLHAQIGRIVAKKFSLDEL